MPPRIALTRTGAAGARRRTRPGLLLLAGIVGAAIVLAWSGVTFLAAVNSSLDVSIAPKQVAAPPSGAGSALPQGQKINVAGTPPTNALTIHHGKPHKDTGRQLFRIQVDPSKSGQVSATFAWLNPDESPFKHGYVLAALYYQIPCSTATDDDLTMPEGPSTYDELSESGSDLCFRAASDEALLTQAVLSRRLMPNGLATNRNYLYLVASILNTGHHAPPGQQPSLTDLKFLLLAR